MTRHFHQDLFRTTANRRGYRPLRGNYAGLSFGTPSVVSAGVECPVPEVGLMPYGIDVRGGTSKARTWCSCVFGTGTELYNQCVGPDFWFYPWTVPGKAERGWNWEIGDLLIGGNKPPTTIPPPQPTGGGGGSTGGGGYSGGGTSTGMVGAGLLLLAAFLWK